jgi:ribose transport system substrate-binding protein
MLTFKGFRFSFVRKTIGYKPMYEKRSSKMKRPIYILFSIVAISSMILAACAPQAPATPAATEAPPAQGTEAPAAAPEISKIVVIGKSVHPYWSNVELGVKAAGKALGLAEDQVIFFVPPKEDVNAQIQTMETYIAQGATGIALAPSDPNALEPVMKKAAEAGIIVTTLDTPPVDGSVSKVYIGTDNFSAGMMAGDAMKTLIPDGGVVGIGRGSDTALNALQRTDGFLKAIEGSSITTLEPLNDKEDSATALQLANSAISANPDMAGAFGVYAYNGPAWATAIKEANKVGMIKLVSFDATTDIINGIKECVIQGTIAQREYDMGYKSVELIYKIAMEGEEKAMADMGVKDGIIDTGVDVITAQTLKDYEAGAKQRNIPLDWNTEGWDPASCEAVALVPEPAMGFKVSDEVKAKILEDNVIKITWIPKALNNPVFEAGKVGAETKAAELTKAGPYTVEIMYVGSVASDIAEQVKVMEDAIAAGAEAVGISCNEPTGCKDPIDKAMAAGIPVMTWDSDSPESARFTYLGVDNYEGGQAAAELLKKALPDGGKIALLSGVPGAANLEARIKGFEDSIVGTNLEVVQTVFCDDDVNKGVTVVEETMTANPDLNGWFFVGLWPVFAGDGAMPLWEAATASGMKTVAFDTLPVELDWVKSGKFYGLVGQKYWGWGYDTTQMIYDLIVNGATYESFTNSGMDLVTINNVDAMAKAWETTDFTQPLPPP